MLDLNHARSLLVSVPKIIKLSSVKLGAPSLWPQRRPVSSEGYRDRKQLDKNLSTFSVFEEILMQPIFPFFGNFTSQMVSQYLRAHVSRPLLEAQSVYCPFLSSVKSGDQLTPLSSYLTIKPPIEGSMTYGKTTALPCSKEHQFRNKRRFHDLSSR